jgi:replicative DNA helicase
MMIDKKGVDEVIDILNPEAFYKEVHQYIFEAIFKLFQKSEPIDILTVSNQLKKDENHERVGGDFYLISLTQKVSSSAHIEFHSRIILQKFIQRKLIEISSEIIESSYDETTDVFDLLDSAESKIYDISQGNIKKNSQTAENLVVLETNQIEEISKKHQENLIGLAYCVGSINLRPLKITKDDDFLDSFKINTLGAINAVKMNLPSLTNNNGSILFFSTIAVQQGFTNHSIVSSSKGAIEGLT